MSNLSILLDSGHGGMAFEHYLTPGKQSPSVPPGIYEGEFNRRVCEELASYDDPSSIRLLHITPGPINISLTKRVSFVNQFAKRTPCALISIHANAAGSQGWSDGNGFVVFHSRIASQRSRLLAGILEETYQKEFYGLIRSRGIKEANHTITTATHCPAVLLECGFMTNLKEAKYLKRRDTQKRIAWVVYQAIKQFNEDISC